MKFILNPSNNKNKYLEYLNACFHDWGDSVSYKWCFRNSMHLLPADIFLLEDENDQTLAGSSNTYRTIQFPDGTKFATGTMTGSWTLPEARGKGCFTEIIKYSLGLIETHSYDFLMAYVTEQNASFRRLKNEGSYLLNTNYVRSEVVKNGAESGSYFEVLDINDATLLSIFNIRLVRSSNNIHYHYNFEDFVIQFIKRPRTNIVLVKSGNEHFILEETNQTFRILYASSYNHDLISKLMYWAGAQEKNVFFMTTKLAEDYAKDNHFTIIPGYLTLLANTNKQNLDCERLFGDAFFDLQYGDKM